MAISTDYEYNDLCQRLMEKLSLRLKNKQTNKAQPRKCFQQCNLDKNFRVYGKYLHR